MLENRILRREIPLKSVSAFVCNHINIPCRSVEIRENKRHPIIRKHIHIASRALILSSQHIEELHFPHLPHELCRFRRKRGIHLLAGLHNLFRCSVWLRISFREEDVLIIVVEVRQPESLSSLFLEFFHKGNQIPFHLEAKIRNILLIVTIANHSGIAKFGKIRIAQKSSLLRPILHECIIEGIQLFSMLLKEGTVLLPCLLPGLSILRNQERTHKRKIPFLSFPGNLRRSK